MKLDVQHEQCTLWSKRKTTTQQIKQTKTTSTHYKNHQSCATAKYLFAKTLQTATMVITQTKRWRDLTYCDIKQILICLHIAKRKNIKVFTKNNFDIRHETKQTTTTQPQLETITDKVMDIHRETRNSERHANNTVINQREQHGKTNCRIHHTRTTNQQLNNWSWTNSRM